MARSEGKRSRKHRPGPQAPAGTWSPRHLKDALARGTSQEKVLLLTELGILTKDGELAPRYRSWGEAISRTSEEEHADER